jgi:WD40 repeat protein/DNA-binding XRE family transcriptional regulator
MSSPIPASLLEKFTTFGDLLRFLRRRVGLTQIELATVVGYSDTQISRLEQNQRLPDIPTLQARFVPVLELENESKAVARLLDLAANVHREDAPGLGLCPYKGLNYFDETDADLFAGRDVLTARLVEHVLALISNRKPEQERFLAVVGASGSGKSSLVRAGLVPALRWNPATAYWPIHVITPTAHPLESLAASLTQGTGSVAATARFMDDLAHEPRSLSLFINQTMKATDGSHFLLVVDQFEELFALCRSEEERAAFIENLLTAASLPDGPAITLITLRADFYAHCSRYPHLREALSRQQEYIGAMSGAEMRCAIEEPAYRGHWEFEPGLVDLLLREVGQEPGALPLLSHALFETWQRRRGRKLTFSGYASSGGVRGAIAETAEAVFADQFSTQQQAIARRIFLRLTELGDETSSGDTRRQATFSELVLRPEDEDSTQFVLKALADARLVTVSADSIEVAHEALIREWPTLRTWLEDNREGLRLHRNLTESAAEWLAAGRDPDLLYRGARLAQAREWAEANADDMNPLEREYLAASQAWTEREAAERELQRQRELDAVQKLADAEKLRAEEQAQTSSRLRKRAIYLAVALFLALGMAATALFFGYQTRQAAVAAQKQQQVSSSRELAAAAIGNLEIDPQLSLLLALQAAEASPVDQEGILPEVENALRRSLQASRVVRILPHGGSLAVNPDGITMATGGQDGFIKVWQVQDGQQALAWQGHQAKVTDLAYSPDGRFLASAGLDGKVHLWQASSKQLLHTWLLVQGGAFSVAFSPDGKLLAAGGEGSAWIWNANSFEEVHSLPGHNVAVSGIGFSPDGELLSTIDSSGLPRLWEVSSGDLLYIDSGIQTASIMRSGTDFSPSGNRWAYASGKNLAKIRQIREPLSIMQTSIFPDRFLIGHSAPVMDTVFSPDGTQIATGSMDGTARLWDATTGESLITLSGHTLPVTHLAFLAGGKNLATTSQDNTTRIWDISPAGNREVLTFVDPQVPGIESVTYSPDGRLLSTIASIYSIVHDATTGEVISETPTSFTSGSSTISPDGKYLAVYNPDGSTRIKELTSGKELLRLDNSLGILPPIAASPDGTRLAVAGQTGEVQIFDLATGSRQLTFPAHPGSILSINFSPDGTRLATGAADGTAQVWDVSTGEELLEIKGQVGGVSAVAFRPPDGLQLATGSEDNTFKLWDAQTGILKMTFVGPKATISSLAFSPDGRHLAASSRDGIVHVYTLDLQELVEIARRRIVRSLTDEECQQYLHRESCPISSPGR